MLTIVAWTRIKTTAAGQRQLWREVGEALLKWRQENPADRAFEAWCGQHGFGDMDGGDRADAMWLAENWAGVERFHTNLSHPARIRQAHRDSQASQAPTPDLTLQAAPPRPDLTAIRSQARKINALHNSRRRAKLRKAQTRQTITLDTSLTEA